jgi:hypothetical protein
MNNELAEAIQEYVLFTKPLLTVKEASKLLGFVNEEGQVNHQVVYDLIALGMLRCTQLGYKKITRAEIDRFIDEYGNEDINELIRIKKATIRNNLSNRA